MRKHKIIDPIIESVFNKNFRCYVDIDYDTERNCDKKGCGSICRCQKIINPRITGIKNIQELVDSFTKNLSTVLKYAIERILVINKIYDTDCWDVIITSGYYGEEIDGVCIMNPFANNIDKQINQIKNLNDNDIIRKILEFEYGYVLPILINKSFQLLTVNKDLIIFGQTKYYKKIDTSIYKNYQGISGIAVKKDDKFRLIDGYHRTAANKNKLIDGFVALKE
ncbi:MAG: hypothetical protein AABY32_01775 [Nanoarchaeota archaeon]